MICTYIYCNLICIITVISEPADVAVCNGTSPTFTCILDRSKTSDDIQWYRLIKDTNTTIMVNPNDNNFTVSTHTGNATNSSLTITNTIKSHTGYYWVGIPSMNVCNVSLTVLQSMYVNRTISNKFTVYVYL